MKENYNIQQLHFLVVDDNKHMSMLIKNLLHALGSRMVAEANDAADAFAELTHFPADIIITDYHMQPLDGLDFVRLVRTGSDSPNPFVPIIMLSGHTEMNKIMQARDAGVHEYLAKPISAKSLYSRIDSIIARPREFIETRSFFGPDRRRRAMSFTGPERRQADLKVSSPTPADAAAADAGEEAGLSQAELDALFD
ncbi:MAG: response regulator [Rhodospirillales bacterium]|jgi:CheY-like chemotaxis protein